MKQWAIGIAAAMAISSPFIIGAGDHSKDIEGCHWNGVSNWVYPDNSLCRGTGEDPTINSNGKPACANGRMALMNLYTGRISCIADNGDPNYDYPEGY